jgi:hypothetical protein
MSLQPHRLSSCCGVPVLGNEMAERGICSNCKQPCNIDVVDDGERSFILRMAAIKRRSIAEVTRHIDVTGFNRVHEKITVEFNDRRGNRSHCIINNKDFFKWASANSYLALLPEVEYIDGEHWDKQPHDINRKLNVTERVRFYNSIDKNMLENYLDTKIPQHYATTD